MDFHQNNLSDLDDLTEEHLGFSALSDGLGFSRKVEPFSQTQKQPENKQPAIMGTGATLAGPVSFSSSIAKPTLVSPRANLSPAIASAPTVAKSPPYIWASPLTRSSAFLADLIFLLTPLAAIWIFLFRDFSLELILENPLSPALLLSSIFFLYFFLSEGLGGQSPGKMLLGIQVVEDDKYMKPIGVKVAVIRTFLFVVSLASFLGIAWSLIDRKGRTLHDMWTKTAAKKS